MGRLVGIVFDTVLGASVVGAILSASLSVVGDIVGKSVGGTLDDTDGFAVGGLVLILRGAVLGASALGTSVDTFAVGSA